MKYIDADKLKAEIERRRLQNRYIDTDGYEQELFEIIDSLQQEQPDEPDKSLEEAANEYEKDYYDDCSAAKRAAYHGFIAGSKWQGQKDEARIKQAHDWGFGAGSEWQKAQDTRDMFMSDNRHFNKVYELGKKDMKEQMLKDAVEAIIIKSYNPCTEINKPSTHGIEVIYEDENKPYLLAGDKVRIIIVKED